MFDNLDPSSLVPFVATAGKTPRLSGARIIEAIIIAAITAGGSMYVSQAVLEAKFDAAVESINHKVDSAAEQFNGIARRLERRMDRMEGDFYIPRGSDAEPLPAEILTLPPAPSELAGDLAPDGGDG